jgi:hypothetical protein
MQIFFKIIETFYLKSNRGKKINQIGEKELQNIGRLEFQNPFWKQLRI